MFTGSRYRHQWPKACVFDCDGLLLASTGAWDSAYEAVAELVGARTEDLDLPLLLGASIATAARKLTAQLGQPIPEQLLRERLQAAFDRQPPVVMPGVHTVLHALSGRLPLAVASNGPTELVHSALQQAGLLEHFTTVVTADMVTSPKPAPHVYQHACQRLHVDPTDAIAFEDSPTGARSARDAGLIVVGVGIRGQAARTIVDLGVPRLDDPKLLDLLGLHTAATH